jgi:hypothetical protein
MTRTLLLALFGSLVAACAPIATEAPTTPSADPAPTAPHPADGGQVDPAPAPDLGPAIPSPFPGGTALGSLMPQVIGAHPTHVLSSPKVVAITYDNDPNRSTIESFFSQYAASSAWAEQTAEYGIGALTVGTPRHLAGNAPASPSGDAIVQTLASHLVAGGWGTPNPSTIYEVFFPAGSRPGDAYGYCCTDFDGYHSWATIGGVQVAYAIVCMCPGFATQVTDLEELTTTAAHETIEAASDPWIDAYVAADDAHAAWTRDNGGELGDMCDNVETSYWKPADMSYTIQRTWSNAAAAAGHDPCVGAPAGKYYQAVPYLTDEVDVKINGKLTAARGVKIGMGASGTLTLTVFADDPAAGPFDVRVEDYSSAWLGGPKLLEVTTPAAPVAVGGTVQATIKVLAADPALIKAEQLLITTTPVSGGPSTNYFAFVGQP